MNVFVNDQAVEVNEDTTFKELYSLAGIKENDFFCKKLYFENTLIPFDNTYVFELELVDESEFFIKDKYTAEQIACHREYFKEKDENGSFTCELSKYTHQTEEMCFDAVKKDGRSLKYVKEQTYELCLMAVKFFGLSLLFVKNKTSEICLEAVKQNGLALKYVEEQTPEICLEVVKQCGKMLKYIKNKTPEICFAAIRQNGLSLEFIEEQTPEICLEAVKQNSLALKFVKRQTPELCLEAVKRNGFTLKYVKEQTSELCLEAVKQNNRAIKYVQNKTEEIIIEAMRQYVSSLFNISSGIAVGEIRMLRLVAFTPAEIDKKVIVSMKESVFDEIKNISCSCDDVCAICQENVNKNESIKEIKCSHKFHINCLRDWLTKCSVHCPLCKAELCDDNQKQYKNI